jgi:putative thioredoxin
MTENPFVLDVTEATFEADVILQSNLVPVLVDFWAPWCGPCRMLGPLLEKLADEANGAFVLARVNVDENSGLATRYGVQGIPAVKAFKDGGIVDQFVGAQPEARVREFVNKLAPTAADLALSEALSLLALRQWAGAEAAARRVLADQPGNGRAALTLVKALLAQGQGCQAEDRLDAFPRDDAIVVAEKLAPLARLLCEVQSADGPQTDSDVDALYFHSAQLLARGQMEAGLDGLLDVLRQDKRYRKGEPRLVMLAVFELLGEDDPVTRQYRNELASVLF